ncbi:MAG: NAD(P)H-hydrate dehydratase [Coprobacillus sp.]
MYIGSQKLMQEYDQRLLRKGYTIEALIDKASDCLIKHMYCYEKVCLLCGPGNNGADGLSLAIKLYRANKEVTVFVFESNHSSTGHQFYLDLCYQNQIDVVVVNENQIDMIISQMKNADLIVDGIFGFGQNASPRGIYQTIIEEVNQLYDKDVISIDIPTGLDCNTGIPYQSVICATKTITLTAMKNGFLNPDSLSFTGEIIVEELAVEDIYDEVGLYQLVDMEFVKPLIKHRSFDGHKGTYGRVGMITGSLEYKGAALLSSKSAVYTGTGITTVVSTSEVIDVLTLYCPEVTVALRPPILQENDFKSYDSLLIGCGLGLGIDAYRYVIDTLSLSKQPLVIDADALTILSSNLELLKKQQREIVLTPHMGEFKRLCNFSADDDIIYVAREFAREHHVTLVLKGPYTIVTNGSESYRIKAGNEAMASGGMGDVLAGIITSLLGQGYSAIIAAIVGVYLHGYTGDQIAKTHYTVVPSLLIDRIPVSMKELIKNI